MEGSTTDIKKGTVSKQDAGIAGDSSSHFAPRFMEDGSHGRQQGRAHEWRRACEAVGVQRPRKRCAVHPQPSHGRDHSRAAVLGPRGWYPGQLFAETRSGDRRAFREPLAERQRRRSHRDDIHQGTEGDHHRRRRSRGQSAVPQHVLPGVERARVRVERLGASWTRAGRTPAGSSPE